MRVVGYVRVSTDEQSRDGVSLGAQAEKVRLFSRLHDLELVELVTDPGASAKSLDRPGLARVMAMLDSGEADGVVVAKLDRLTRSVADLARLLDGYFGDRAGKQLFSVGDSIDTRTAAGRLVLNVLMSVAQWERETIVERTRDGLAYKRGRRERISRLAPYGADLADDGKTLVDNPAELAVLEDVRRWREQGWALRKIAAELQARGVPTKGGRPWSHGTVQRLVRRTA